MKYGHFELQRGDHDGQANRGIPPRWGAEEDPQTRQLDAETFALERNSVATLAIAEHVRSLQEDLVVLGFSIIGTPSGIFDIKTEWAVREIQIYSKMPNVAQVKESYRGRIILSASGSPVLIGNEEVYYEGSARLVSETGSASARNIKPISNYIQSLQSIPNEAIYRGPISGIVNTEIRAIIDFWLENNYRCPVIVEAWQMQAGARAALVASNIWAHDSMTSTVPRVFMVDFTGYYSEPAEYQVVGDFQNYASWCGPRSIPPAHTSRRGELISERLTKVELAKLNDAQLSTFKVIRAVSEVECMGHFDSITAYDNAFISAGPCHWTLGITNARSEGSVADGELAAYLSYLNNQDPDAYMEAFGFFGLHSADWADAGRLNRALTNYTARIYRETENGIEPVPRREEDFNYYKTWHWFCRFVQAGRNISGYQTSMWGMARMRIRDVRDCAWITGSNQTIGDVFTSEAAIAMLMRWHVRFPADVCSNGLASPRLRNVLNDARASAPYLRWDTPPATWTDQHESAILRSLAGQVASRKNGGLSQTISQIERWPDYQGRSQRAYELRADHVSSLSKNRNSFIFDPV